MVDELNRTLVSDVYLVSAGTKAQVLESGRAKTKTCISTSGFLSIFPNYLGERHVGVGVCVHVCVCNTTPALTELLALR